MEKEWWLTITEYIQCIEGQETQPMLYYGSIGIIYVCKC